jgi:hypothetical protein
MMLHTILDEAPVTNFLKQPFLKFKKITQSGTFNTKTTNKRHIKLVKNICIPIPNWDFAQLCFKVYHIHMTFISFFKNWLDTSTLQGWQVRGTMQLNTSFFKVYDGLHILLLLLLTSTYHLRGKNETNFGIKYFCMLLYFKTNAKWVF